MVQSLSQKTESINGNRAKVVKIMVVNYVLRCILACSGFVICWISRSFIYKLDKMEFEF